jgi:hypothetical protein
MRNFVIGLMALGCASSATAETMSFKITVGTNDRNGVCYIYLPTNPDNLEEPELEISVKADNGNVNVGMAKLPSSIDTPKMRETLGPVKLTFGKKKIKSDKGSLRSGYYYKYLGWWEDSKNGLPVLSALKDGTTVTVEFEGKKYGPIQIQQSPKSLPNYGYNHLRNCIKKNGGTVVF